MGTDNWPVRRSAFATALLLAVAGLVSCGGRSDETSDAAVDLQFRPVLAELAPGAETIPDPTAGEVVMEDPGGYQVLLGPALLSGSVIDSADLKQDAALGWVVAVVFRPGRQGIDGFNAAAEQCYEGLPTCPASTGSSHGRLAVVLDGELLTAPTIAEPSFERDSIELFGGFSEDQARSIAGRLSGRPD